MQTIRHRGPNLGALAIVYTVLFIAGLCAVSGFGIPFGVKPPWFPGPWEPASVITSYFQGHPMQVLICASLQFGAMIPLGIYTATIVSRLRFLGVSAAGPYIALFGGFLTAAGELSWLNLPFFPKFLFLIPLTRFPGFIWLIAAGFAMPVSRSGVPDEPAEA